MFSSGNCAIVGDPCKFCLRHILRKQLHFLCSIVNWSLKFSWSFGKKMKSRMEWSRSTAKRDRRVYMPQWRKNFFEACSTSMWLTNRPYDNPPNRSRMFFSFNWKKSLIFWNVQKSQKTLISTLVDLLSIFAQIFSSAFKTILPEGNVCYAYDWELGWYMKFRFRR